MADDSHWLGLISKTSVANLGNCPAGGCRSLQDIQDRCAYDMQGGSCLLRVRDVAQFLGILDCMPVLVFAGWALWFTYWRIQEIVDDTDKRNTTLADYTIKVRVRLGGQPWGVVLVSADLGEVKQRVLEV